MNIEKKYNKIEKTFLKYADASKIVEVCSETDSEPLASLPSEYLDGTCKTPLVRKTVLEKIIKANEWLKRKNANYQLIIVDAYRSPEIQEKRFQEIYDRIAPQMQTKTELEILEECHKQIAVPSVAGHPTGGAVDVLIFDSDTQKFLDFGTGYCDWNAERKLFYDSPEVSKLVRQNRRILRNAMLKQGFLQYMAEWWHFSYGDKEWAFANKKQKALYSNRIRKHG